LSVQLKNGAFPVDVKSEHLNEEFFKQIGINDDNLNNFLDNRDVFIKDSLTNEYFAVQNANALWHALTYQEDMISRIELGQLGLSENFDI